MPRFLFIGILVLSLTLTACQAPSGDSVPAAAVATSRPLPAPATLVSPSPTPAPLPSAEVLTVTPAPAPTLAPVSFPDPARYTWAPVVTGLTAPTDLRSAGDGSGRLFILEQRGVIRVFSQGQLAAAPFLDITERIGSNGSEQGLLGLAFHPKFAENGYLYVNYTDRQGTTHLSRFTASGASADPASEVQLLTQSQPFANHNGGSLAFGPDGYLYAGLGDGGSGGDPYDNAQSLQTWLGKTLRLDVNTVDTPYGVPMSNPFNDQRLSEIWALGLRNPWRFSFDSLTGDLWIADVGQNQWEEIDFVPAGSAGGLNFGWNRMEGTHPYNGGAQPEFTAPVAEYPHGPECSVTGGYVYRGAALPEWQGIYFYGDYCTGKIWGLATPPLVGAAPKLLFETGFRISTFGVDEAGELYVADYGGAIYRLEKRP